MDASRPAIAVVTPPAVRPDEARLLAALLAAGVGPLHLRKPGAGDAEMRALLAALPPERRGLLTVHHRPGLYREFGLGGLHLRATDLEADLPAPAAACSASLHAPDELVACPAGLRYACFSPVFPSISKPGHRPAWDPEALSAALARTDRPPVFALGGVTPERLASIRELGFDGAAVLGWFWRDDGAAAHVVRWRELVDAWSRAR